MPCPQPYCPPARLQVLRHARRVLQQPLLPLHVQALHRRKEGGAVAHAQPRGHCN